MASRARLSDLKTLWQRKQQEDRAYSPEVKPETKNAAMVTEAPPFAFSPTPLSQVGEGNERPNVCTAHGKNKRKRDIDFQRQMRDDEVVPLPPSRRVIIETPRPAPIPKQRLRDEIEVLALAKYGESPSPATWDIGQEWEDDQTFLRAGLSPDVLRKLRRGQWAIQSELDLHGMIVDEAHDALVDFLVEARSRGLRCVRIIHGKGLTSPDKTPVLKGKVRRWLVLWDDVLAYCEPAHHA
ncbi:MAG: Smr/MutS family protein, partial [Burkholderiales bacterium]|nr:Smr/MutS family protein [Burkholderiales bacterium]